MTYEQFLRAFKEARYFTICVDCVREIDLRDDNFWEEDTYFIHQICPPKQVFYT